MEFRLVNFHQSTHKLNAKDEKFFISDWPHKQNIVEIIYRLDFNYGKFATIKRQAGLNSLDLEFQTPHL
jgi:hypothetical protein